MFSTIPRIGIPVLRQNVTSLLTSDIATPWGGGRRVEKKRKERGEGEEGNVTVNYQINQQIEGLFLIKWRGEGVSTYSTSQFL